MAKLTITSELFLFFLSSRLSNEKYRYERMPKECGNSSLGSLRGSHTTDQLTRGRRKAKRVRRCLVPLV